MYPFIRLGAQILRYRRDPLPEITDTHVSHHMCWPWDLDIFGELNNGRALSIYDLGRIPYGVRVGLWDVLRCNRWALAVAGASVRYRRRIHAFERIRMTTRGAGWDDRFIYVEQAMWKRNGDCAGHVLIRSAITGRSGILPPDEVLAEMGYDGPRVEPPDWVTAWSDADKTRPWPPMQD